MVPNGTMVWKIATRVRTNITLSQKQLEIQALGTQVGVVSIPMVPNGRYPPKTHGTIGTLVRTMVRT